MRMSPFEQPLGLLAAFLLEYTKAHTPMHTKASKEARACTARISNWAEPNWSVNSETRLHERPITALLSIQTKRKLRIKTIQRKKMFFVRINFNLKEFFCSLTTEKKIIRFCVRCLCDGSRHKVFCFTKKKWMDFLWGLKFVYKQIKPVSVALMICGTRFWIS